jgi:ribosome biogenesis GTPase
MATRQEKRAHGDLRHRARKERLQKLLAAKPKPQTIEAGDVHALVIGVGPGVCTVSERGETRLIRCPIPVAPGDLVTIRHERVASVAPRGTILSRLDPANPRRERVIAANIDLLVVVASITNPPLRPGLIDRYLIAAARGGIQPLLCVNKIDLMDDTVTSELYRVPIICCSARTGQGIDDLRYLLAGSLSVLAGHSGVGKSSILNALADTNHARTGRVSDETGKGRHTTSASHLYELGNGARIIDTPGIREFGLGRVTIDELQQAFPEFAGQGCRFKDCSHIHEPGCRVRDAGCARYASYLRISSDL